MTTDFTACVQTELEPALIQLSIVPPMSLSLVLLQTEYTIPVAFKVSIVVTSVLGLGTVEAGIVTPQVFLPHTPLIHK